MIETAARRPARCSLGLLVALVAALSFGCGDASPESASESVELPLQRGGRLVLTLKSEPESFNPVLAVGASTHRIVDRMHGDLLHIDPFTQEVVPNLAESWDVSADGTVYTVHLRKGLRFSDGEVLDADDVVFTYRVHLDPSIASPQRDLLSPGGTPLTIEKVDSDTVEFSLPRPLAAGPRLFDSIAILPEHRLREAWSSGRLQETWQTSTPASEIVGAGPFTLGEYRNGEFLDLDRNPYYWKTGDDGDRRPYLDGIRFLFVSDDDARVLRFQAGEAHIIDDLGSDNFAALSSSQADTGMRLVDAGPSLEREMLIPNLNDLPPSTAPEHVQAQAWLERPGFRSALSLAIDRDSLVRLAYQGRASALRSNVSPGDRFWHNDSLPPPDRDLARARETLEGEGFRWAEDQLIGPEGAPVRLSILTSSTNSKRLKMAAIIEQDLAELGIEVRVVSLPHGAVVERLLQTFAYDLILLGFGSGDADPNPALPFLLSTGGLHVWRLNDTEPLSPWQAEIDALMKAQLVETDRQARKRLYDRVQEIVAEELPVIPLVSPHVLVGAQATVGNFRPAILEPNAIWNADELFLASP